MQAMLSCKGPLLSYLVTALQTLRGLGIVGLNLECLYDRVDEHNIRAYQIKPNTRSSSFLCLYMIRSWYLVVSIHRLGEFLHRYQDGALAQVCYLKLTYIQCLHIVDRKYQCR